MVNFSRRAAYVAVLAVLGAIVAAVGSVTAWATAPQYPQDGQVVTTNTPHFTVLANTSGAANGQPIDAAVTVALYSASGAQLGGCAATYSSQNVVLCSPGLALPDGSYSWRFTWTHTSCSSATPSSCSALPMTSPMYRFTVSTGTGSTTSVGATSTVTTTTTVTVTVPTPKAKTVAAKRVVRFRILWW